MKAAARITLLASIVALTPLSDSAATLIAVTQNNLGSTCDINIAALGPVTASCGSFSSGDGIDARASYGDIGIRSQVDGPTSSQSGGVETTDFWRGSAGFSDTLSFSVDSGTFRLFTDIAATLIEDVTGSFGGSSIPAGRNTFSVRVGDTTVFQRFHEYQNSATTGLAELAFTADFGATGTGFIDLAFSGGLLDLNVSMFSEANCGAQHSGNFDNKVGTCLLGVDAFNSFRLIGSTVLDEDGIEVANGFLSANSGFDYIAGVEPHDVILVPEPASALLFVFGTFVLFAVSSKSLRKKANTMEGADRPARQNMFGATA